MNGRAQLRGRRVAHIPAEEEFAILVSQDEIEVV